MKHPHDPRNCVVGATLPLVGYPKAYWSWVRGQIYSKLEKIPYDDGEIKAHGYPGAHRQEPPYCLERLGLSPWVKAQPKNNTCGPQRGVRERFPVLMCQMIAQCTQPCWSPQPGWLKVPMLENPAFHSSGQNHWPKGFRTSPIWAWGIFCLWTSVITTVCPEQTSCSRTRVHLWILMVIWIMWCWGCWTSKYKKWNGSRPLHSSVCASYTEVRQRYGKYGRTHDEGVLMHSYLCSFVVDREHEVERIIGREKYRRADSHLVLLKLVKTKCRWLLCKGA